jgi:hypothetical protein
MLGSGNPLVDNTHRGDEGCEAELVFHEDDDRKEYSYRDTVSRTVTRSSRDGSKLRIDWHI